jgi:hypothetical protein
VSTWELPKLFRREKWLNRVKVEVEKGVCWGEGVGWIRWERMEVE